MYGMTTSIAACMIPIGPPASVILSRSSPDISTLTPSLRFPSMFFSGTTQSSKMSSLVSDPLIPSLSSFLATLNPSNSFWMMNAVIPLGPASGSVLA